MPEVPEQKRIKHFWSYMLGFYVSAALVTGGAVTNLVTPLFNNTAYIIIMIGLTVVLPLCLLLNVQQKYARYFLFLVGHVISALGLIYVTGADNPYNVYWVLLMVMSYLYIGSLGFLVSASTLLVSSTLSNAWRPLPMDVSSQAALVLPGIPIALFIVFCAYIAIRIVDQLQQSRHKQVDAQEHEILQRERLFALINTMGDAVLSIDDTGKILVYNAATLSLLDTNATLDGQQIDQLLKLTNEKGEPVNLMQYIKSTNTGFSRRDLVHHYTDDDKADLYINVSPIHPSYQQNSLQSGYILIMRDITKEKSLEEERDEFISVVSHELRTPIAITEGDIANAQFIAGKTGDVTKVRDALEGAHEQILFLAGLVNDLSTLSRAERGKLNVEIEDINLAELVQSLAKNYHEQAVAKGLEIIPSVADNLPVLRSSTLYVREILQNFITNSIKYTEKGSITIGVHADVNSNGVVFSIQDTGIGISKSDQKKVFDKFFRSEDYRTRATSGTGLGLYVTMKLAHLIHASINLTSELNKGSTFTILIPNLEK